jgi:hypothetical protein
LCSVPGGEVVEVNAEEEKEARCKFLAHIGMKRLPKGSSIARKIIIRDMPLEDKSLSYTVDEQSIASFIVQLGHSIRTFIYYARSVPTFCDLVG